MVAFPDQNARATGIKPGRTQGGASRVQASGLARLTKTFAGAGLCMAALGIWLVPSFDAGAQLTKLCGSLLLLGIGAYLVHVRKEPGSPIMETAQDRPKLRVHEYDSRGRAKLRHN